MCLRHLVLVAFLLNVPSLLTAADTRVQPRQGPIVPESQAAREHVQLRTDIPEAAIRHMTELVVTDSGRAHGNLVGAAREIAPVIRIDGARVAKMKANVEAEALRDGFAVVRTSSGWTWTAAIESPHAEGLRLFLKSVADSDPFRAWIYSNEGEVHGPYMSGEMSDDGFWTNTIYSARAYVQVQSASPRISLEIPKVAHLEPRRFASGLVRPQGTECLLDVSCARDHRTGKTDSGYVMQATNFFGQFAFPVIAGNQTDPQILIKLLDGRPINGKWWVFFATLTDVEFTLSVRDTNTNITKNFYKAPSSTAATFDTEAF